MPPLAVTVSVKPVLSINQRSTFRNGLSARDLIQTLNMANLPGLGSDIEIRSVHKSRTADLVFVSSKLCARPSHIVKIIIDGSSAEKSAAAMVFLADAIAGLSGVTAPRPLAVLSDIEAVVMPFIHGVSLDKLLAGSALRNHQRIDGNTSELINKTGQAIAWLHGQAARSDATSREVALKCFLGRADRLLEDSTTQLVTREGEAVQRYGDFLPHHVFVMEADGALSLIDPQLNETISYREFDIARFLNGLSYRLLRSLKFARPATRRMAVTELSDAFLEGYSTVSQRKFDLERLIRVECFQLFFLRRAMRKCLGLRPPRIKLLRLIVLWTLSRPIAAKLKAREALLCAQRPR